nr:hypothetical protein BDOA9_0156200 [Bradyrhizobium sp. DOA9]
MVLQPSTQPPTTLSPAWLPQAGSFHARRPALGSRSSRVRRSEKARIAGAANSTTGSIAAHAISQDTIQCRTNSTGLPAGKLATPAAISEVSPDWMMPKTK